jgi:DNA-binding MarR family transcriptional regulator
MKSVSMSMSLTKLVVRFLDEIHRFEAGYTLPLLHAAKLTTLQLTALEFVAEPRTVSSVAAYLGLSRPATSQMIQKLVRRKLVQRSEGAVDRRERSVMLAPKGKILLEKISAARSSRISSSISVLPKRTSKRLKGALRETVRSLDKAPSRRPLPARLP